MKALISSDWHGRVPDLSAKADVLLCAGDISDGPVDAFKTFTDCAPHIPRKIAVAGNHEFYGEDLDPGLLPFLAEENDGVDFLDRQCVEVGGRRIIGATLWTNFELYGECSALNSVRIARNSMDDYIKITDLCFMKTSWHFNLCFEYLCDTITRDCIVMTHHAPFKQSVARDFRLDPLNPAYVNDLRGHLPRMPAMWIHGHTHTHFDYLLDGCRVICNPLGQEWDVTSYVDRMIVDLDNLHDRKAA